MPHVATLNAYDRIVCTNDADAPWSFRTRASIFIAGVALSWGLTAAIIAFFIRIL